MPADPAEPDVTACLDCGFEAPADSEQWDEGEHIALGAIPQCPDCGSKTTTALSEIDP